MSIMPNTDALTCGVCQNLYTEPVVHRLCGLSFDRQCIKDRCPAQQCGREIVENDLVINYGLLKIVKEHRSRLETPTVYYIILLDTSKSMWYSDALIPFAFGESRFKLALQFLNKFFQSNSNSEMDKISLVTFDTATLTRFDFESIQEKHFELLEKLTCNGKHTALFDAIDDCLTTFEKADHIPKNDQTSLCLLILTDGGNNFGKKESTQALGIARRSGKLQISGHMIQIGDTNCTRTRTICDAIKFKFNHFHGGNVREFADSFTNSIKTETRARASRLRNRLARKVDISTTKNQLDSLISDLPDVPNTRITTPSRVQALA